MAWIENEITFANSLVFAHASKCAEFIQDIFDDLAQELPNLKVTARAEEPIYMPKPVIPLPTMPKRQLCSPSPTRRSPEHKRPLIQRPITAPVMRAPLREVSDNASPRLLKSSITSVRGSQSPQRSPQRPLQRSPMRSPQRSNQTSPLRSELRDSPTKSPVRSAASPVRSPVRYPKLEPTPSQSRLMAPTVSSLQHATQPSFKKGTTNNNTNTNTTAATKKTFSGKTPLVPPLPTLLLSSSIPRPFQSKIPVSVNSADTTLPSGYSTQTQTPFRVGLKKPLPKPFVAPSPSQITLPDISDNDTTYSLNVSWAATPEITRQLQSQGRIDPTTVFGNVVPLEMDKVFAKPQLTRGRTRTSSAAWEHDGVTIKEREKFAKEMGYK